MIWGFSIKLDLFFSKELTLFNILIFFDIKYTLRKACHEVPVNLIIVIGDNIVTAIAIVKDSGILWSDFDLRNFEPNIIKKEAMNYPSKKEIYIHLYHILFLAHLLYHLKISPSFDNLLLSSYSLLFSLLFKY